MIRAALDMEYEPVSIVSHDGLKLFGKVYASGAAAPWLILFHGYRSRAERDFCGGLRFGVESGYNVLLVDQRAHGRSEGKCLSFGVLGAPRLSFVGQFRGVKSGRRRENRALRHGPWARRPCLWRRG